MQTQIRIDSQSLGPILPYLMHLLLIWLRVRVFRVRIYYYPSYVRAKSTYKLKEGLSRRP